MTKQIGSLPEKLLADDLSARTKGWRKQYKITKNRRWRFDLAFPKARVLVEVNGERYHSTYAQQRKDAEKNNYAAAMGYRVFVIPASLIMSKKRRELIVDFLTRMVCGVTLPDDCTLFTRPLR